MTYHSLEMRGSATLHLNNFLLINRTVYDA